MAFRMQAKYPGVCDECRKDFDAGSSIMYCREEKVCWHIECYQEKQANEKSPIKPVQSGVVARYNPPRVMPNGFKRERGNTSFNGGK